MQEGQTEMLKAQLYKQLYAIWQRKEKQKWMKMGMWREDMKQ